MIYTAIDNFYVTEEQLENSPSRADGISKEVETELRIYGCEIIQEGGILLKLPQAVMATGQVLLQRFYCKESLLKYNVKRVAWACCWLATKLEEFPRRSRDVISVFVRIDRRREMNEKGLLEKVPPLDIYSSEYTQRKTEMVKVERHLLRTFGFVLHVDHPHKVILHYLNLLKVNQAMKQESWNLANDSLRTTLCVRYKSEVIACGLILLASRRLSYALPTNPPWYQLFLVAKSDVYTVAREVHALLASPKARYISVYRETLVNQGGGATHQVSGGANLTPNATPQLSESDTEGHRAREGSAGVVEISGTSGDNPRSTDAKEGRDAEQRSGPIVDPERAEDDNRSERRYRSKRGGSYSASEDERSDRRRSRSRTPSRRSRSHSRDFDRSWERRHRDRERGDRYGRDDDRARSKHRRHDKESKRKSKDRDRDYRHR